jgi:hypothetical protein
VGVGVYIHTYERCDGAFEGLRRRRLTVALKIN